MDSHRKIKELWLKLIDVCYWMIYIISFKKYKPWEITTKKAMRIAEKYGLENEVRDLIDNGFTPAKLYTNGICLLMMIEEKHLCTLWKNL